ncbi:cytochrome c [Bosea sp. PAMC 26642]|uniref:cytochrome c n=1 Tax=Bosea sp. (strain PAMC 26642) TaxID=1792307 RepID=UPI00143ACC6C|nr:cytochrome c [Bosea sp. PAMC 26642]
MRAISAASRDGAAIAKADKPFDPTAARAVFATYRASSRKLATLFPEGSQSGNTRAAAAIWADRAGFTAAIAKFDADAAAGDAASTTLAGFRQAFEKATDNCAACHETYRVAR